MLEKLKEYKELIAILVFFLGGFAWLNAEFPDKGDLESSKKELNGRIETLNCLVDRYMRLTQLQLRSHQLEKELEKLNTQIAEVPTPGEDTRLSPAMRIERDQMLANRDSKRTKLRETTAEMERINEELARHACGR